MRSNAEYTDALNLAASGLNDCQIARAIGVPRSTVRDWRKDPRVGRRLGRQHACSACGHPRHDYRALSRPNYAYLLAMYLGDGSIDRLPRTWRLRITLDLAWPGVINECKNSVGAILPSNRILVYQPDPSSRCNTSADIRDLFTSTCDLLGIEWRQMNARNISVARRESVSYLDEFVGPKR